MNKKRSQKEKRLEKQRLEEQKRLERIEREKSSSTPLVDGDNCNAKKDFRKIVQPYCCDFYSRKIKVGKQLPSWRWCKDSGIN